MRYTTHSLPTLRHMFPTFADIAKDAVGRTPEGTLADLDRYALHNTSCVIAWDEDTPVGYMVYGEAGKLLSWHKNVPLRVRLSREGIGTIHTACHVHLRKAYWKTGTQKEMSRVMARAILDEGVSHLLLWGYATDQLAAYSLKQPGGRVLDGVKDPNGRQVGVRDLAAYLEADE